MCDLISVDQFLPSLMVKHSVKDLSSNSFFLSFDRSTSDADQKEQKDAQKSKESEEEEENGSNKFEWVTK